MARARAKDYIRALKDETGNKESSRIRNTNKIFVKFFTSEFSDKAIQEFKKLILKSRNPKVGFLSVGIRAGLEDAYLEAARYYSRNGELEAAETLLTELLETEKYAHDQGFTRKVSFDMATVLLRKELNKDNPDPQIVENLRGMLDEDARGDIDNELGMENPGVVTDFDIFRTYFNANIPASEISAELFPENMTKPTRPPRTRREPRRRGGEDDPNNGYREELSANARLRFIIENFNVESALLGEGKFKGSILFKLADSDLVVVEKFWEEKNGLIEESYGQATYIMPKDVAIDLPTLSKGGIRARGTQDQRIKWINHNGDYYTRLMERYQEAEMGNFRNDEPRENNQPPAQARGNRTPNQSEASRRIREDLMDYLGMNQQNLDDNQ